MKKILMLSFAALVASTTLPTFAQNTTQPDAQSMPSSGMGKTATDDASTGSSMSKSDMTKKKHMKKKMQKNNMSQSTLNPDGTEKVDTKH
ncbi:hypothetical protein [Glaciimonas sp. PCH181]|uniref:hypothetical protein n=1 Tax=Glaciimonas sp. PCH181 TaxID=2133943 RepID=UPI000D3586B9|nr:hypothetical protein [Glaciimonas sp. PCH181]PUA20103.1 hypothetical protein C7W93_10025 [Glaciimonas sp. PCH181]